MNVISLQAARGNFTVFTIATLVQLGTKMNGLDFVVKRHQPVLQPVLLLIWSNKHFGMHFFTYLSGMHGHILITVIAVTDYQAHMTLMTFQGNGFKDQGHRELPVEAYCSSVCRPRPAIWF